MLNGAAFACLDLLRSFLRAPEEAWGMMREYLLVIFCGIGCLFPLYGLYRAVGRPDMSTE